MKKFLNLLFIFVFGFAFLLFDEAVSFAQKQSTEDKDAWFTPKKVELTSSAPKVETRGKAKSSGDDHELVWPAIETHRRALLTVRGNKTSFSQGFDDGEAPSFSALKQEFEPGRYEFELKYFNNELGKSSRERTRVLEDRRTLLQQRKELIEKGDRKGAKRLLDQANRIRSEFVEKQKTSLNEVQQDNDSSNASFSKTGKFDVDEGGMITLYDPMQAQKKLREEKAKRAKAERENAQNPQQFREDEPAQEDLP